MKDSQDGLTSRPEIGKDKNRELESRLTETIQFKEQWKKKTEEKWTESHKLLNYIKHIKISIKAASRE